MGDNADFSNDFETMRLQITHNFEHLRSLNRIMWEIPVLVATATGGLMYLLAQHGQNMSIFLKSLLLLFLAYMNCSMSFIIRRVRNIVQAYIENINRIAPGTIPSTSDLKYSGLLKDFGVVKAMQSMMIFTAAICLIYGIYEVYNALYG